MALLAVLVLVAAVAYAILTWLVAAGRTVALDDATYELFRPGGLWSRRQEVSGVVAHGLQPAVCGLVLAAVATHAARRQRSWAPLLLVVTLTGPAVAIILATKALVDRMDPAGGFTPGRGAYPSGHAAFILLCSAGVVMLVERPVRWWARLVVAAVCLLMASSVLCMGLHWVSDVVGGTLVGLVVVGLACQLPVQGRSHPLIEPQAGPARRHGAATDPPTTRGA